MLGNFLLMEGVRLGDNALLTFVEAMVAQRSHHYVVTHISFQLPLKLSIPLDKQAGESHPGTSLASFGTCTDTSWYEVAAWPR